jgi:hypothetical protein
VKGGAITACPQNINIFAEEEEGNIAYRWCISGGFPTAGIFPVNKQFYTYTVIQKNTKTTSTDRKVP